jgi:hypothetical protein
MDRRDFLQFCGHTLPLSFLLANLPACTSTASPPLREWPASSQSLPDFLRIATSAPNPHNTQAWLVKIHDKQSFTLFLDLSRVLRATDPILRQVHIGLGCFLEVFQLAAGAQSFACSIEDLTAEAPLKDRLPIAKVRLENMTGLSPDPLSSGIAARRTHRGPYQSEVLSDDLQKQLIDAAEIYGSIKFVANEQNQALNDIAIEATRIETMTKRTHEETRQWFRFSEEEHRLKGDGLSIFTGMTGFKAWVASKFFISAKDWFEPSTLEATIDHFREAVLHTPHHVMFTTDRSTASDWLNIGRSYLRFQLAALREGYYLHPLSQVLQEYPEMRTLQEKFNSLLEVKAPAKIQMWARIGRPQSIDGILSPRRPLEKILLS